MASGSINVPGRITAADISTASTSAYGVTKLSDATNSTATDLAATPNAVKKAYDLANDAKKAVNAGSKVICMIPMQIGNLFYTGEVLSPTLNGYDSVRMTLGGDTSGIEVGTYNITVTPKTGYKWFDGTVETKIVSWTISKASYAIPSIPNNSLIYTGSYQEVAVIGYDNNILTGVGCGGIDVGTYTARFNLKDPYHTQWSDGTTDEKTITWYIVRASGTLTLDKSTMTLDVTNLTGTITTNRHGSDGVISATSSNTDIATVSINSSTGVITVTGKVKGSVEISVTMAQGTNYNAVTTPAKCSVTVKLPSTNLEENDWSDLSAIGAAGNGASYFSVGDCMPCAIQGTVGANFRNVSLYAFILGFNHNGVNGIYFQCFKYGNTTLALCDWASTNAYGDYKTDGTKLFNMNHWGNYNYGGWKGCDLRYDILGSTDKAPSGYGSQVSTSRVGYDATESAITNPVANTFMAALPSSLRSVMKPMTVYTDNKGNGSNSSSNVTTSVDYLPLLSEFEVHGKRTYANQYEQNNQKQYDYYKNGNSKIFCKHMDKVTAVHWWCRSPYYGNANSFCNVGNDGSAGNSNADSSFGLAPAFRVA